MSTLSPKQIKTLDIKMRTSIEKDDYALVESILSKGLDPNLHLEYNKPFLIYCNEPYRCRKRDLSYDELPGLKVAQLLIDHGATVSGIEGIDETPLAEAARHNFTEFIDLLFKNGLPRIQNDDPVLFAANTVETAKYLISHGANIHVKDKWKNVLLINAIQQSDFLLVDFYIDIGVDLYQIDRAGITALHAIVRHEDLALFEKYISSFDIHRCNQIKPLEIQTDNKKLQKRISELLGN